MADDMSCPKHRGELGRKIGTNPNGAELYRCRGRWDQEALRYVEGHVFHGEPTNDYDPRIPTHAM